MAHALDVFAIVCTWVFGIVGLAASAVAVNAARRRPRVTAKWTTELAEEGHGGWEGLVAEVWPRQRAVRIESVEVELRHGPPRGLRRRRARHYLALPSHPRTPCVLQDGEVLAVHYDTDAGLEDAHLAIGDGRLDADPWFVVRWGNHRTRRVRL